MIRKFFKLQISKQNQCVSNIDTAFVSLCAFLYFHCIAVSAAFIV